MKREIIRGKGSGLLAFLLVFIMFLPASAMKKEFAENPLLHAQKSAKPQLAQDVICNVGFVHNRITNSTVEVKSGINDWTILFGDDALETPSMMWLYPANYAGTNHYLYFGSLRIGKGDKLVHLSTDTSPGITVTSTTTDATAISLFDTYFSISDNSPLVGEQDYIGVEVHSKTYAWSESYRDDFIVYDFQILNVNEEPLESVYVAMHADCDVSAAAGGDGAQGFWRDDMPGYYRNETTGEYISYMYDADNPTIAGDDTGGKFLPKESTGYIGTRLLYCPPRVGEVAFSKASGHGWWDWNSDPGTDADWMTLMKDGLWLPPPPSPHDFRYLMKLGPFEIDALDSIRVVLAFGVGEGLQGLRANLEWAKFLFDNDWVGPSAPTAPTFTLTPGDRQVLLEWNTAAETTPDPATGGLDFEGYRVWRKLGTGSWVMLMECDLIDDVGLNTGLVHSYLDADVNNGFQYSYVVTAYDKGDPLNGIEPLESGKAAALLVEPGNLVKTANAATSGIHVVPNPFVKKSPSGFGFTPDINNPSEERVMFVNLPDGAEATVTIYSLTGDEVISLKKTDPATTTVSWDLISKTRQKIVAGVYLYVVESTGLDENFIGKFMVVR